MENKEWKNLILSVGKLNIRKLTPVEVALLIQKAIDEGMTRKEIAERCMLADSTMLGKFLNLLKLDSQYWHLIDWSSDSIIALTSAQKVAQHDRIIQNQILESIMKYEFNKLEVDSLGQRIKRSGLSIEECINEARNKRYGPPVLCYVVLGTFSKQTQDVLSKLTQYEKDQVVDNYFKQNYCEYLLKIKSKVTGFTIIISEKSVNEIISKDLNKIEKELNEFICKTK
jgi:hypothetical protein